MTEEKQCSNCRFSRDFNDTEYIENYLVKCGFKFPKFVSPDSNRIMFAEDSCDLFQPDDDPEAML